MMSDTVDYGEWKHGKRLTGISFAGTLFVLKMGLALSGAVIAGRWPPALPLGRAEQSPSTLHCIVACSPGSLRVLRIERAGGAEIPFAACRDGDNRCDAQGGRLSRIQAV